MFDLTRGHLVVCLDDLTTFGCLKVWGKKKVQERHRINRKKLRHLGRQSRGLPTLGFGHAFPVAMVRWSAVRHWHDRKRWFEASWGFIFTMDQVQLLLQGPAMCPSRVLFVAKLATSQLSIFACCVKNPGAAANGKHLNRLLRGNSLVLWDKRRRCPRGIISKKKERNGA